MSQHQNECNNAVYFKPTSYDLRRWAIEIAIKVGGHCSDVDELAKNADRIVEFVEKGR